MFAVETEAIFVARQKVFDSLVLGFFVNQHETKHHSCWECLKSRIISLLLFRNDLKIYVTK